RSTSASPRSGTPSRPCATSSTTVSGTPPSTGSAAPSPESRTARPRLRVHLSPGSPDDLGVDAEDGFSGGVRRSVTGECPQHPGVPLTGHGIEVHHRAPGHRRPDTHPDLTEAGLAEDDLTALPGLLGVGKIRIDDEGRAESGRLGDQLGTSRTVGEIGE